jgi:WD40 repeat protein
VDVDTDRDGKSIEVAGTIGSVSFSPDSKRLEGGVANDPCEFDSAKITVWDVATGSRICTMEDVPPDPFLGQGARPTFARSKCWSPDGTRLAIAGPDGAQIHLFDTATGKLAKALDVSSRGGRMPPSFQGGCLAFSPDGRRIACVVGGRFGQQPTVNVLDTETGKELLSLPLPAGGAAPGRPASGRTMLFTPDGHRLLHFAPAIEFSFPAETPLVRKSCLRVHSWDATPRPEAKEP